MPEPDPVADGNEPIFQSTDGLPIRDVLMDVDVWRLEQAAMGIVVDVAGDGSQVPALHLGLVEHVDGAEPRRAAVVIRFGLDDLAMLVGEIAAALKPEARRALGDALLDR